MEENSTKNTANGNGDGGAMAKSDTEVTPVVAKVKEQAQQAIEVTRQTAGNFMEQAQNQITSRLSDEKTVAADTLNQVVEVVRKAGQGLREQEQAALGQYADSAAEAVTNFSNYLRQTDLPEIVRDVETVARQRPALFIGGAFALGLLAGRFLRSSGHNPGGQGSGSGYDPLLPVPTSVYRSASSY